MKPIFYCIFFLLLGILGNTVNAQYHLSIPGYTGYAVPAEDDEITEMFSSGKGLINWTDTNQTIQYYATVKKKGVLDISIRLVSLSGASLQISAAGKNFEVIIPASKTVKTMYIGKVLLKDTGALIISIQCLKKNGKIIADVYSLEINSSEKDQLFINQKERRNAASVHLVYPMPDTSKTVSFYTEIKVPKGSDIVHSYFMACGFARGYLGMQVNGPNERRIIFSVWDAGDEAADRGKVPDSNRVKLLAKGEGVEASDFGNEGTGGHSHWVYNWKADSTYKFLVTATQDSASRTSVYAAYFYSGELSGWKFLAAFKAPKDGGYLKHLYSFVENFSGVNGQLYRKAYFGNQWIQEEEGAWKEITLATFSCDATGRAKDRIDFGGGASDNQFYLWNGGFRHTDAAYDDTLIRSANKEGPSINLYHHIDSTIQAARDAKDIAIAIRSGKLDTSGSSNGLYYKILKDGTGDFVSINDTVTAYYKGYILKDGYVFADSKEETATFPLNRLIKGWQIGLPLCRVGGTIRLMIPSGLAYSIRNRASDIPPNSILIFDITVKEVKK